ncbi:MAG: tRNA pseudouridine(38-40) synthase TruA [Rhodospirillaceae bacterium]|jgi:tRNA pseudouridine38-40 synthase|nr:tRNA pseudouridine(38-40) synthase TruA [Rhodospirillaceae bacterium]MBT3886358.1 tRNA pseudouridine(38-40) synthase TruA [Rhodospirillaceae bacterium]MBT4116729.1 tRNA pseudouridine(38-40) synthase TruA [Rhodospirillaceae bacterium]MBT4671682.1 tRNA pseudouridine(38-40) synthase TruA [Rhodospirillaceae bacterium]MBT4719471.1 tRNA pseudouridine(38-40) synthase TruA [Rhodospirillaceae bacterium]
MTRYKLIIEYDGGPFHGWQRQDNGASVQQSLENAVTSFCGEIQLVEGAGRTDAGVHALGQVAHVDIEKDTDGSTVRDALNFHLRGLPVTVLAAEEVDRQFHARFSARERSYLFRILDRRPPPAVDAGRVWWVPVALDAGAMHEAAQALIGNHDFSSFRAAQCQADSPVKTLDELRVTRAGDEIHIQVRARSFLHHQVRNFAGTLKLVGEGKWSAADIAAILAAKDRTRAGPTAPPEGLYLVKVGY